MDRDTKTQKNTTSADSVHTRGGNGENKMNMNIHKVTGFAISPLREYDADDVSKNFATRDILITTDKGEEIHISLYTKDIKTLSPRFVKS